MSAVSLHRVRVWDLPTRLFHWALALSVIGAIASGLVGGAAMVWHLRFGQAVLTLLVFRLVWGLLGGRWSRFSALILSPAALVRYLRGHGGARLRTGHSPLGSLSVLAFLVLLSLQVASGLVSNDEIATSGPLSHLVANATVAAASGYHKGWGKLLLLAVLLLHLGAIAWYSLRGHRLVAAMWHGDKSLAEAMPASRDDAGTRLGAALCFAACLGLSFWVFSLAPLGF